VCRELELKYGNAFNYINVRRMMQFASQFTDEQIVVSLGQQLSWTHMRYILPLKSMEAKLYYAEEVAKNYFGVRDLQHIIARKSFERKSIANLQLTRQSEIPFNAFKDPYLLDTLDLKENYLEADLEKAILQDLEKFILEFGKGFAFMDRQKRIMIGEQDFYIDLLFYNRELKRLVAIDLKLGEFRPEHFGQMSFYLSWLNDNERKDGEEKPIGLILCTDAKRQVVELMGLDKSGITVAEYWTKLPPKKQFEDKIQEIMSQAKERLERRKGLPISNKKQLQYFYEKKSEDNGDDKKD
jgi:predicted nuclease of restriction endonuclease-like (RecB) superfamily